jgi:hypothetical protein
MYTHTVHVCQPPSVSSVYLSRYSSISTLLYPKISELFLLSNFRKVSESCPNSLRSRWETRYSAWHGALTPQPTAGWPVRTPANLVSSPSMAQSSTYMVLRAVELDRFLLDPTPLYSCMYTSTCKSLSVSFIHIRSELVACSLLCFPCVNRRRRLEGGRWSRNQRGSASSTGTGGTIFLLLVVWVRRVPHVVGASFGPSSAP